MEDSKPKQKRTYKKKKVPVESKIDKISDLKEAHAAEN